MNFRLPARIGAFAGLGIAFAMGTLALREVPDRAIVPQTLSTDLPNDPLQAMLRSCQLAGQAAGPDPGCLAAWAENRRRFLGSGRSRPSEPVFEAWPGKLSEPMQVDDGGSAPQQEQ
ncbi:MULTISPECIES: putative entry exclusion protein TrbK-alt [unclassified Sphingomonas]|uniref:putative entry exclusion protein TrbK-alt n=1 Tax=unclassified Sphingomonas TaxID=196159 RepID=UPI00082B0A49|nr:MULTISPECIES: putative entry exclusion protein TrbK-alt [unclassified Sphingomonas]